MAQFQLEKIAVVPALPVVAKRKSRYRGPACGSEADIPLSGPRSSPGNTGTWPEDGTGVGMEYRTGVEYLPSGMELDPSRTHLFGKVNTHQC